MGAGDAMRPDSDDERRKRESETANMEIEDMNKDENVFTKIWQKVVEGGKKILKNIQESMSGEQKREY